MQTQLTLEVFLPRNENRRRLIYLSLQLLIVVYLLVLLALLIWLKAYILILLALVHILRTHLLSGTAACIHMPEQAMQTLLERSGKPQ